ncbi:MAG: hypothetical protein B7X06_04260 [Verrucomicrobia bacterium 21-51-4]|nr:MAG: hypothetical protein B7X06_04260 [Verrucomicrobia bacterium 21-51-4]
MSKQGFDPQAKEITLMLHTFVGKDDAVVKQQVKKHLVQYIKNHLNLYETSLNAEDVLTDEDKEALAEYSFEKYYETSGLLGSIEKCAGMAKRMEALGVTEIACLIDFGLDHDLAMQGVEHLCELNAFLAN